MHFSAQNLLFQSGINSSFIGEIIADVVFILIFILFVYYLFLFVDLFFGIRPFKKELTIGIIRLKGSKDNIKRIRLLYSSLCNKYSSPLHKFSSLDYYIDRIITTINTASSEEQKKITGDFSPTEILQYLYSLQDKLHREDPYFGLTSVQSNNLERLFTAIKKNEKESAIIVFKEIKENLKETQKKLIQQEESARKTVLWTIISTIFTVVFGLLSFILAITK
jgi:hypothetical protein